MRPDTVGGKMKRVYRVEPADLEDPCRRSLAPEKKSVTESVTLEGLETGLE